MPHARTDAADAEPLAAAAGLAMLPELWARLIRLAVKLVWNRSDAEEIVQEAFRLALDRGWSLDDGAASAWLWRTVCNLCLNRRRKPRPEPLGEWLEASPRGMPHDEAVRNEAMKRLRLALERLPDQQRAAIVLRSMEQLDYPRIAEIMGLTESAVRAHVHLARRRLADEMAEARP